MAKVVRRAVGPGGKLRARREDVALGTGWGLVVPRPLTEKAADQSPRRVALLPQVSSPQKAAQEE